MISWISGSHYELKYRWEEAFFPSMLHQPGVYSIWCAVNHRLYVGAARIGFDDRWREHALALKAGRHWSPKLQADYQLFCGQPGTFWFSVLAVTEPDDALRAELWWRREYVAAGRDMYNGFNPADRMKKERPARRR